MYFVVYQLKKLDHLANMRNKSWIKENPMINNTIVKLKMVLFLFIYFLVYVSNVESIQF